MSVGYRGRKVLRRGLMDTEDAIDDQAIDDTINHARACHATLLRLVLNKRAAQAASAARQAAAVAWREQAPSLVRSVIQADVAERERERAERRVLASELAAEELAARRRGLSKGDDLQEAAALRCELAAARSAWAAESTALHARLRLLGEQHDPVALRGTAAAGRRRVAAVAGGRAEAAVAQAATLSPSQDEAAVASLRANMRAAAQGGVSRCGCRHEDEAACASTTTEPSRIKWHTLYKVR